MEPYAIYLLRRFDAGETLDDLVASEDIQRERILMRLRAARQYVIRRKRGHSVQETPLELAA